MAKTSDQNAAAAVAKPVRPQIKFKPWYARQQAAAKAARKAGRIAGIVPPPKRAASQPKPKPIRGVALWAWQAAKARGYSEAQWQALGVPSPALRDITGMMNPDRLPPPGQPWPPRIMARFNRLAAPVTRSSDA